MQKNNIDIKSVLDIGCADGIVSKVIDKNIKYMGVDIGADIYKRTNSKNIYYIEDYVSLKNFILQNKSDLCLLLDVLEHTFDFTDLFETSLQSANKYVFVSLPNEENIRNRIGFLLGKGIPVHSLDMVGKHVNHRHLWLIQMNKAKQILEEKAKEYNFILENEIYYISLPNTFYKRFIYKLIVDRLPYSVAVNGFGFLFRKR
jgi:predicted TPR repeat methyltransferase